MKWLLISLAALAIAFLFDKQIFFFSQSLKIGNFLAPLLWLEQGLIFYPLILIITSLLLLKKKEKRALLYFFVSAATVALTTLALKWLVARPRPMDGNGSFPSGHAAFCFMILPYFENNKYWLVFALFISFSRLLFGLHYLSDLIAGGLLGYFVSLITKKIKTKRENE